VLSAEELVFAAVNDFDARVSPTPLGVAALWVKAADANTLMDATGVCTGLVLNNWGQFYSPKPTARASSL
jgi:hypothetical protein